MRKYDCDVLVVGSGAGGLATAVAAAHRRLKVLVVEKEPVFGGTTARSGGWMWVPNNGPAKRAGVQDSVEKARTYLQHETGDHFDADRIDSFLDSGPKAVEFFETQTALKFDLGPIFADYHPVTSAQAAEAILEAVGRGEWRVLIGQDAEAVDSRVRADPWTAYD